MRGNFFVIGIFLLVLFVIEFYAFQGVKYLIQGFSPMAKRMLYALYWIFPVVLLLTLLFFVFGRNPAFVKSTRALFASVLVINLIPKLFFGIFLLLDDLQRGARWLFQKILSIDQGKTLMPEESIGRSDFLLKTGVLVASVPLISVSYGIAKGAYDYRVKRVRLPLKNLPASFHGLRIGQISDIHSGSFFNKRAVEGGVEMLLREKTDLIFFTGDLVNEMASEVKDYLGIFGKLKAPLGVFSTLGNHDYGDYRRWASQEAKRTNLLNLMEAHKIMGYDLLMNENRILKQSGDQLAIIGVENWGAGARWPKYGKLAEAVKGTDDAAVKLLLSHDPSHWDAQIRPEFKDIDVTFSGHTHGCQFGIEIGSIKWSPVQYLYKQWAGLYRETNQLLYVNRGFGFIGFPGRIGMPPEITVFELVKA